MELSKSDPDLQTLVSRINNNELDLQPSFQRGEVWDLKRRQRLIDTVLRGWYVPAVHFVIDSDNNDLVLDGQQRLTAIRDFFNDEFKIDGSTQPPDARIQALDGMTYSELPDSVRREVNRFPIQTIKLYNYNPREPNELFFRLNQSYNLTPSEKRNALHGPARDQIKGLVEELIAYGLLQKERIGFSNGRLAYDDIIARACVSIEISDMRIHINNNLVERYYRDPDFEFKSETIARVSEAGNRLKHLILNRPDKRVRFNKGTLQTWLLYCDWAASDSDLPDALLDSFEEDRARWRRGDAEYLSPIGEVLRIYDDRASYRVTDVSSVLARDLAIHLYSVSIFDTPDRRGSLSFLERMRDISPELRQAEFFSFLQQVEWGRPDSSGE